MVNNLFLFNEIAYIMEKIVTFDINKYRIVTDRIRNTVKYKLHFDMVQAKNMGLIETEHINVYIASDICEYGNNGNGNICRIMMKSDKICYMIIHPTDDEYIESYIYLYISILRYIFKDLLSDEDDKFIELISYKIMFDILIQNSKLCTNIEKLLSGKNKDKLESVLGTKLSSEKLYDYLYDNYSTTDPVFDYSILSIIDNCKVEESKNE